MRRKLSAIEHMIDGNIVYIVTLEGHFSEEQLRSSIQRVQRKHPALRMVMIEKGGKLYYEEECEAEIPLRIIPYLRDHDLERERQAELMTPFPYGQPQLRVVWLQSNTDNHLLFTSSHRICDGMSMLTIVRETLRLLSSREEMVPYPAVTAQDLIGDYTPAHPWKEKLKAHLLNLLLQMIPASNHQALNNEYYLEWSLDSPQTEALKLRCRAEGTSIHAALFVALDRALLAVLGRKKLPAWIESPMDVRRGRMSRLKSDMLFFGGGSLKLHTGEHAQQDFWTRARVVHDEIRRQIEKEMIDIPKRYYFNELLRPVTRERIQTMVRVGDMLKVNGSWNRFALSNLGSIDLQNEASPFRLKDLRLYVHSFNFRLLGLVAYTLQGKLRFYYAGDLECLDRSQAEVLKAMFSEILTKQIHHESDRTPGIALSAAVV